MKQKTKGGEGQREGEGKRKESYSEKQSRMLPGVPG